ncbi:MAG: TolC family protein [Phycisphaerae bacterium]|nr:TolC family protein [Phycisphaerae bacterium]
MSNPCKTVANRPSPWLCGSLAVLVLAGCAVGPGYVPPEPSALPAWHGELKNGLAAQPADPNALASWWKALDDPQLSGLIERAVAGNLDLKDAQARVRQARAARGVTKAGLFPTVNLSGSDTWSHSRGELGTGRTTENHHLGFDAGWELDLFGGVRRAVEAADADLQAGQEELNDTLVSLLSEVALNYVQIRTCQTQLAAVQASLESQEQTYQLTEWQHQAQLSDELAVHQAKYNLESTRSQIPDLKSALNEAMNNLAVLLGEQPGALHEELAAPAPVPVCAGEVAVGVPADVLRQRPDVRKAERQLAAQTARIGVAMADRYPRFSLTGSIGGQAMSLVSGTSATISGGPQVTWAIFDGDVIRWNIEQQNALQEQYLIQYESAILNALEEVENAMTAYVNEQDRRRTLEAAADAAQRAAELALYEYQAGLTDFSDVLDAQRSLLSFQNQLAESNGAVTSNLIRLYKALGGGWTPLHS